MTSSGLVLQGMEKQLSGPVLVPLPSCPKAFCPQHQARFKLVTPQVWNPPGATPPR